MSCGKSGGSGSTTPARARWRFGQRPTIIALCRPKPGKFGFTRACGRRRGPAGACPRAGPNDGPARAVAAIVERARRPPFCFAVSVEPIVEVRRAGRASFGPWWAMWNGGRVEDVADLRRDFTSFQGAGRWTHSRRSARLTMKPASGCFFPKRQALRAARPSAVAAIGFSTRRVKVRWAGRGFDDRATPARVGSRRTNTAIGFDPVSNKSR